MTAGWILVAAALATGCLRVPVFQGKEDAGSEDAANEDAPIVNQLPIVEVVEDAHVTVKAAGYTLRFESGGWGMPDKLVFDAEPGTERLDFDHPFAENAIGVSLYDAYQVNSVNSAGTGERQVLARGPAKVTIDIKWDGPAPCTGTTPLVDNRSIFTFYPDGRIVRSDTINTKETCDVILGSTNAFEWSTLPTSVVHDGSTRIEKTYPVASEANVSMVRPARGWACVEGGAGAIAWTWRDPGLVDEWEMIEIGHYANGSLHFGYYFSENGVPLANHTYVANTALFVRTDFNDCDTLGDIAQRSYQQAPVLTNSAFNPYDGTYFVASAGTLEAQGTLQPGFVLEYRTNAAAIAISRQSSAPGRTGPLVEGADFVLQRDAGNSTTYAFTLFMVDRLITGEKLVIAE